MYARALVFMRACRMSHARNLSASPSHSLVKLHVSCTVQLYIVSLVSVKLFCIIFFFFLNLLVLYTNVHVHVYVQVLAMQKLDYE